MTQMPILKPRKLLKILKKQGFEKVRQEESHIFLKHPDGRTTVIPFHAKKDIGRGLIREILKDVNLSSTDFLKLL